MANVETLLEEIGSLTIKEAADLVKKMEEQFGISAAAPVAAVAAPAAAGAGAGSAEVEEQSFDVILKSFGEKKIDVIKVVREVTGLGLKEAKELVEKGGQVVKKALDKAAAEELKKKLEGSGAVVELQAA